MARKGLVFRTADFIARTLPGRKEGEDGLFAHAAVDLLQRLDGLQEANPSITFTLWVKDGIWVSHDGLRLFMVLPRRNDFRVLYGRSRGNRSSSLHMALREAEKAGRDVQDVRRQNDYHLWSVAAGEMGLVTSFLNALPVLEATASADGHPRNFPGPVRQMALEMFEREGRWCPGAKGRPRHKVDTTKDRIEFDHILPDAKGGSRSVLNVQVLCAACNRAKSATAL